ESDAPPLEVAGRVDRYLFEPDAAVIASRLIPTLAARHGLRAIENGVAYLTGDSPIADAALDAFEVLDCMKYNARSLKRWLRDRGIGHVEVKKRGVPLDPAEVQRALAGDGQARAVVILARVRGSVQAIVARRIAAPTGD